MGFVGSGTVPFDGHNNGEAGLEVGWMIMGVCDKSRTGVGCLTTIKLLLKRQSTFRRVG